MDRIRVNLTGRVIAVTGAAGVLGRAVTRTLQDMGARVAQLDVAPIPLDHLSIPVAMGGDQSLHFGGIDLTDEAAATTVMSRIVDQTGHLDGLANIAGAFHWQTLEGGALEQWDRLYRVNLRTVVACCKAALPHLLTAGRGRIINIGALGAIKAAAGMGAYAASKAGVARLTEALAEELKDRSITVNALLPSILDTPLNRIDMPDADFSRWVAPAAIGDAIAFLLSDSASAITGALIPVTGRV